MLSKIPNLIYLAFVVYFILFAIAACIYPGGSDAFPDAKTYNWFHNYWCDLMGEESKNCLPNQGAIYANIAHVISAISLILFSFIFPFLFEKPRENHQYITIFGILMGVFYVLVLSRFHDLAIIFTGITGVFLFFIATFELLICRELTIFWSFFAVVLISGCSLLIYLTNWNIYYLPFLQKIMLLTISSWMIWVSWLIEKKIT